MDDIVARRDIARLRNAILHFAKYRQRELRRDDRQAQLAAQALSMPDAFHYPNLTLGSSHAYARSVARFTTWYSNAPNTTTARTTAMSAE